MQAKMSQKINFCVSVPPIYGLKNVTKTINVESRDIVIRCGRNEPGAAKTLKTAKSNKSRLLQNLYGRGEAEAARPPPAARSRRFDPPAWSCAVLVAVRDGHVQLVAAPRLAHALAVALDAPVALRRKVRGTGGRPFPHQANSPWGNSGSTVWHSATNCRWSSSSSPNSSSRIGKSRIWTWTNESRSEAGRRDSEWGLSLMS